jgi:hypothetical protein
MKKLIQVLSIVGIAASVATIAHLYSLDTPTQSSAVAQTTPLPSPKPTEITFQDFPLDQPQFIDFAIDELSLKQLSEREQKNQLRDWLLFAVASDRGLAGRQIGEKLKQVPTNRFTAQHSSNWQYGDTRSLSLGNGKVIVLVPKQASAQERANALAAVADKHREELGDRTAELIVFDYEIDLKKQYGLLTRRSAVVAQSFFTTGDYGYYETAIETSDDLQTFLKQVDTLTFVQRQNAKLVLGGRTLDRSSPSVDVEDIAALWQSGKQIRTPGSGFSLNPSYDYRSLATAFAQLEPNLKKLAKPATSAAQIQIAKNQLKQNNELALLFLVNQLLSSGNPAAIKQGQNLLTEVAKYRFQVARYDGKLQGSDVGMVLFYTDLLTKLWALNYLNQANQLPTATLKPFNQVSIRSAALQPEEQLTTIQLRLGADRTIAAQKGDRLLLAHNATRLYGAAYNPFEPKDVKTRSTAVDAFLRWWNSHYEEVLIREEPQYNRLNEIIKWSLVIDWLDRTQQEKLLNFLNGVNVQRDYWFPDWVVANQDQLTFQQWEQIGFYDRGYKGTTTEALPALTVKSAQPTGQMVAGGITLSTQDTLLARRFRIRRTTPDPPPPRDFPNLNPQPGNSIPNFPGGSKRITPPIEPPQPPIGAAQEGVPFSPVVDGWDSASVQRNVSYNDGLEINTVLDGIDVERFDVDRLRNGFEIGWSGEDILEQQKLTHYLLENSTTNQTIEEALRQNPDVESLVKLSTDPPSYLVKLHEVDRWIKVTPKQPNLLLAGRSRRGIPFQSVGSANFELSWVDQATVEQQLEEGIAESIRLPDQEIESKFTADLRHQKYEQVAQEVIADPQKLKKHLEVRLKRIDQLIQQQQYVKAGSQIEELIQLYGAQPDLLLYRAVVNISRDRLNVEAVNAGISLAQSKKNFLDQVNQVLANRSGNGIRRIETEHAVYYVQDDPGLNNLDWNLPIDQSVPLISARSRMYQLQDGEIGGVKLSVLGFEAVEPTPQTVSQTSNRSDSIDLPSVGASDDCEDGQPKQNGQCSPEKPAYVVLSSSVT